MKRVLVLTALMAAVVATQATPALHYGVYGSKNSKTYHDRSACKTGSKIKFENLVQFASEYEAQQKGRGHCMSCIKL